MLNELLFSTFYKVVDPLHKLTSSLIPERFFSFSDRLFISDAGLTDPQQMKQHLLSQLVDIQTPDAIGIWPFAPGIWALIGLSIIVILSLMLFRHYKLLNRYRVVALKINHDLRVVYNKSDKSIIALQSYIHDVLTLLKQVTFTAYPKQRAEVAGYPSNNFIQLLFDNLPQSRKHFSIEKIQIPEQLLYGKPDNIDFSVAMFERFAQTWITQHKKNTPIKLQNSIQKNSAINTNKTTHNKINNSGLTEAKHVSV